MMWLRIVIDADLAHGNIYLDSSHGKEGRVLVG